MFSFCLAISLLIFMDGLSSGWVSPYLAKLTNADAEFHITREQASWIASISSISTILGDVIGVICLHYSGCKTTVYLSGFPLALGWLFYFYKNSVFAIYAARFLSGISVGMSFISFPLYIGEISDPKIRGGLLDSSGLARWVGVTVGSIMGKYLDTHIFAVISLLPNLLFLSSFIFLPNSPYHLIKQNQMDDAAKSLQWYNRNADAKTELLKLEKFISHKKSRSFLDALRDLNTPINRKTCLIIVTVYFALAFSGSFVLTSYMEIILTKSRITIIEPSTMVTIVSAIGIFSTCVCVYNIDKVGRKVLFVSSTSVLSLVLLVWGLYLFFLDSEYNITNLDWIPLVCVVLYQIALTQGVLITVVTLRSELLAPNVKSIACGITSILGSLFAFIAAKSYQPLVNMFSEKYMFIMYSFIMLLSCLFAIFYFPETKGKTLSEIQDMMAKKFGIKKENSVYTSVPTTADDDVELDGNGRLNSN